MAGKKRAVLQSDIDPELNPLLKKYAGIMTKEMVDHLEEMIFFYGISAIPWEKRRRLLLKIVRELGYVCDGQYDLEAFFISYGSVFTSEMREELEEALWEGIRHCAKVLCDGCARSFVLE